MDYTANIELEDFEPRQKESASRIRKWKKRRSIPRKNRKPSRPANYMGKRKIKKF